jgi:hypothetical protein
MRIVKDGNNYTFKFERYDLLEEKVVVLKETTITLPE